MYKIDNDKDHPLPSNNRGRPKEYPFSEMKKGQSFFIEYQGRDPEIVKRNARSGASYWKRKKGYSFITKETEEEGKKGLRIWRNK